jgi:hypothetical protein
MDLQSNVFKKNTTHMVPPLPVQQTGSRFSPEEFHGMQEEPRQRLQQDNGTQRRRHRRRRHTVEQNFRKVILKDI